MRKRDAQRSKVYTAENLVFPRAVRDTAEHKRDLDYCRQVIGEVVLSSHYQQFRGWKRIGLCDGRGRRSACYRGSARELSLPRWARNPAVICHEMAHALTHATAKHPVPAHGGMFCRHFIELVRCVMGNEWAIALEHQFKQDGLRVMELSDIAPRGMQRKAK